MHKKTTNNNNNNKKKKKKKKQPEKIDITCIKNRKKIYFMH